MNIKSFIYLLFSFIVLNSPKIKSQDIINPYILRDGFQNVISSDLTPLEPISSFTFETLLPSVSTSSGYDGEYMISLKYHPWHGSVTNGYYGYENYAKTYSIELVSFPFMMNCFDGVNTCTSTSNERNLETPDATHPYNGLGWGDLVQYHLDGTFRFSDGMSAQDIGQCPDRLVSFLFKNGYNSGSGCATTLPHSILKQTVYLHCGTSTNDPVISSFSWYYDNTRGMMRAYPFYNNNSGTGLIDGLHDVMFAPMIIEDKLYPDPNGSSLFVNRYDRADNYNPISGGIIEGGTIDYFPYSDIQECTEFALPDFNTDEFSIVDNSAPFPFFDHSHPFPSQYLLMNTFLRNANGKTLAGYDIGGLSSNIIEPKIDFANRINQNYFITNDFDGTNDGVIHLDIINQNEKVIFNPSEVTINPDGWDPSNNNPPIEVIFPENYIFKSILGRFPSKQEVLDASLDPQNGNYSDLRQVPVPVDAEDWPWTTTNTYDYPEVSWDDPNTSDLIGFFLKDERFGYYYIENKATVTVRPCVKIYDARFLVTPGGTIRFDDYPSILGYEDKDNNRGRYKIRSEGGAILRNFSPIQYIQNGDIFQSIPLEYIATSYIIAGKDVDLDNDQPTGIYEIKAGANVTFTAGDYINLKDGFYVSGGDFHAVIDENLPVPAICFTNNGQNGGNRVQQQATLQSGNSNYITVAPNPNQGNFTIYINGFNSISSVSIFDLTGRLIYYNNELHEKNHEVQLVTNIKGLMITKIVDDKGQTQMKKVMVE